jgi:NitT/TauT family transport system permease protein
MGLFQQPAQVDIKGSDQIGSADMRRRLISFAELLFPFVVAAAAWQAFALLGPFPQKLFPTVETIIAAFVRLIADGILPLHALHTLLRLLLSFLLAALVGVGLGIIIGRYRWAEDFFLPLVSIGNPVPGLAYAPLFVLWFGLGNLPAVLLVAFAATFPIVLNTWSGVKAVKEIWIRAAQAMGAEDRQLFWKVVLPSALPYVLTGLRLAGIPEYGCDAGGYRGHRDHRSASGKAGF